MKPKWLIGLLPGVILIYLGIYGLAAPMTFALTGTIVNSQFNDLSGWITYNTGTTFVIQIQPAGQLNMQVYSGARARLIRLPAFSSSQYTVEFKMVVDSWSGLEFYFEIYHENPVDVSNIIAMTQSLIYYPGVDPVGTGQSFTGDTSWHTWTYCVDESQNKSELWRDTSKVASWNKLYRVSGTQRRLSLNVFQKTSSLTPGEIHVDYILFDTGWKPPTSPPPSEATFTVVTSEMINNVKTNVGNIPVYAKSGSSTVWQDITDAFGTRVGTITAGTYDFYATFSGQTVGPVQRTLVAGANPAAIELTKGGTPPNGTDWLKPIRDFFANSTVKMINLAAGVGISGISVLMALVPMKKRTKYF